MPNPDIDKIIDKDTNETYPIKNTNTWRPVRLFPSWTTPEVDLLDSTPTNGLRFIGGDNVLLQHSPPAEGNPWGEIIINGLVDPPGDLITDNTPAAVSLASSNNWQCLAPNEPIIQATPNSIWFFQIALEYESNATGLRGIGLNGSNSTAPGVIFKNQTNAVNGAVTNMTFSSVVSPSAATNYYIWARQNSGASLNVAYRYRVFRIR